MPQTNLRAHMVSAPTGQADVLPQVPQPVVGQTEFDKEVEMLNPNPAWLKTMRIVAGMILVGALMWVFIICAFAY